MSDLGHRVRDARIARGQSLRKVAAKVGISVGYLCDIEHGRREPSWDVRAALCRVLGMDVAERRGLTLDDYRTLLHVRDVMLERDAVAAERDRLRLALENVRQLASRMQRRDPGSEDAGHLLRFCAEVGVVPSILRSEEVSDA